VDLRPYENGDLALTEALETDPSVMRELGGAVDPREIPAIHERRLAPSDDWWLVIVPDPGGPAAGTLGIWDAEVDGEPIHETGWTVLPDFQGRGIASRALALLLQRAEQEPRFQTLHAFPSVTNSASNALCRKFGFELVDEREHEFRGQVLRCNRWRLDL
jgi:RimJ/RimL family protein N-acetyltransferase